MSDEACGRCDGSAKIKWTDGDGWPIEDECPDCLEPTVSSPALELWSSARIEALLAAIAQTSGYGLPHVERIAEACRARIAEWEEDDPNAPGEAGR